MIEGVIQIISQAKFLEIFKKTEFSRAELVNFYKSIKRSIIYNYAGRKGYYKLVEIERAYQWPILSKIDNPTLPIYEGADEKLLSAFLNSIQDEKQLRNNTDDLTPRDCWVIFRILIRSRIELYENIFGLTKDELAKYKKIGERYEKTLIYREKRSLRVGLGAGAILGGAATLAAYYNYKKRKTDD